MTNQNTTNDNPSPPPAPRKPGRGCGGIFFVIMVACAAVWGAGLGGFVRLLDESQTTMAALDSVRPKIGSRVYSSDAELLGEYTLEPRQLIRLNEMPLHLQKAFIATEDDTFYEHKGVRPDAILSALRDALRTGNLRGGSTITQQLVRNIEATRVGREQTLQRKLREAFIALQLERQYTKDEILELYLNQIFLGVSAFGVEAAAQQYYGKSCRELTLAECALLAGLPRAPNVNEPFHYPENARERRNIVLKQMLTNHFITQEEHDRAVVESVEDSVVTPDERAALAAEGHDVWRPNKFKAPYFVEEARRIVMNQAGLSKEQVTEGGLEIFTTVDMRLQHAAEDALFTALEEFDEAKLKSLRKQGKEKEFVPVSGALVCLDNRPGYEGFVRALVGGRDFEKEQFNTATQAKRQPGSSIKPFIWATAIDNGLTPSHTEMDEPIIRYDALGRPWAPENFGGTYTYAPITLRRALERSVNVVSVRLVERVGMPLVRSYLERAGIRNTTIDDSVGPTIALGTPVVTVLDQCVAYATFANGGLRCDPIFITQIKDRDGFPLYQSSVKKTRAFEPDLAYVMTHLMEGVINGPGGTGTRALKLKRPCAGKTGTSNDSRNVWFCGFTPDFTCVVWIGYRDNRPLGQGKDYTGGRLACPVWTEFMLRAHEGLPVHDFIPPESVTFYNVDRQSGLAGGKFREAFMHNTGPPIAAPEYPVLEDLDKLPDSELIADL
ncbi:MAG: PBP1A family penicillin-binding protein [Candidatus Hydrogenedentes bacterium]|nr:PBP1A family penicillin-binding protein [Candidatus Hydrogenedentota bacterium]